MNPLANKIISNQISLRAQQTHNQHNITQNRISSPCSIMKKENKLTAVMSDIRHVRHYSQENLYINGKKA